jgi:methionyl-tRNA formyltransferase
MVNSLNSHKPSIVFFGNERLATGVTTQAPVLRALIESGYSIEALIVNHEQATSRKQRTLEVEELANQHKIPVYKPQTKLELIEITAALTSPIAVLVAYGRIISESVIKHFAHGIVNVHPSALPKHRGSTPIESVILDGSTSTAVSIMQLTKQMDAGGLYAQNSAVVPRTISKQELTDQLGAMGATMVVEALPGIIDGSLTPQAQNESQATYTTQIRKQDGELDFTEPAEQLERQIRAYAGWPGSRTQVAGKDVVITNAIVIDRSGTPGTPFVHNGQLAIYCSRQALLITKLKPAGKNEMPSADFLRGNPL